MNKNTNEKNLPKKQQPNRRYDSINESFKNYGETTNFIVTQANHEVKKPTKGNGNNSDNK